MKVGGSNLSRFCDMFLVMPWLMLKLPFLGYFRVSSNVTASFTLDVIRYQEAMEVIGVCVQFYFKSTSNNNTLSVYVEYSAGRENLLWHVKGDHGANWTKASVHFQTTESFTVSLHSI